MCYSINFSSRVKSVGCGLLLSMFLLPSMQLTAQTTPQPPPPPKPMPYDKEPAADAEIKAVRQVIDNLFDGMRAGDADMVASVFAEGASLHRAGVDREGKPRLGNTPVSAFVEAVGRPTDKVWDERIWNVDIKVDDRLASAWMNFAFYLGDTFSHCGVNSVQFFKGADGWKMISLADTNHRDTCEIPEHVKSAGN
ncbi:MAG: hypothetical protein AAF564_19975 [Bacteroidota bacterium]